MCKMPLIVNMFLVILLLIWLASNKDWQAFNQIILLPKYVKQIMVVGQTVQAAGWGDRQINTRNCRKYIWMLAQVLKSWFIQQALYNALL